MQSPRQRISAMCLLQDHRTADIPSESSLPYPAQTKQAVGAINGIVTDVMSISFSDKIMVTITQGGRLAHWVIRSLPLTAQGQCLQVARPRFMFLSPPTTPPKQTPPFCPRQLKMRFSLRLALPHTRSLELVTLSER